MNCMHCNYYHEISDEEKEEWGECHRYAPRAGHIPCDEDADIKAQWPTVAGNEWCGEMSVRSPK